ncbi:MAG: HK97 family phage prohead protease [Halanaerobiales bacterium]
MKKEIEKRTSKKYEVRAVEEDGKKYITCEIPYNSISEDMGFREVLKPGCFKKTIKDGYNIRALYQHNQSVILGAVKNNTLQLEDTETSLRADIKLPNTQEANDVYNLVKDGYITNCSFGFRAIQEEWNSTENGEIRNIVEAQLYEISPVTFPAYEMTQVSVSLRSLEKYDVNVDDLMNGIETKDKDKIKKALEPIFKEEDKAVEEPAVEDTGVEPTLYEKQLDLLLY